MEPGVGTARVTAVGVGETLLLKMPEASLVLAVDYARAEPRDAA